MFYAMRHKEKKDLWLGISTTANENAEFCNSVTADFDFMCSVPFISSDRGIFENVIHHNQVTKWFNSGIDDPSLTDYDIKRKTADDYELIELGVI
ncbi:hypothetical protein CL89_gp078 [Aeromonas phage PX29]|uniref:Uncharacterized protein n=1 Tax=Aeromonas phage PX29 TaxID=926067 RepID=E5DQ11_9CAUD|nr:hypothetical protein CL89_gp078 [Aeromonas phage PX29]ADQ52797.1 conserved hypothetical protein [Aeromonas phage PX29]